MFKRQKKSGGLFGGGQRGAAPQGGGGLGRFAQKGADGQVTVDTRGLRRAAADAIGTRFTIRQNLISLGDDFWIKNERGEKVIKVDGKMLRLRDTIIFEDRQGRALYHITARMVDVLETMDITRPNGTKAAVVKNALFSPLRDRWNIKIPGDRQDLDSVGGILQHEYKIKRGNQVVAEISKKWIALADNYTVELVEPFDAPLMLAITVCIDMMSHNNGRKSVGGMTAGSALDVL